MSTVRVTLTMDKELARKAREVSDGKISRFVSRLIEEEIEQIRRRKLREDLILASTAFQEVGRVSSSPVGEPDGIIYSDGVYDVVKRTYPPEDGLEMIWLAIRHVDGEKLRAWGDYQRIKNELAGKDWIGFEIYPAEDNVQNTSNTYHIWAFPRWPCNRFWGWSKGINLNG